MIRPLLAGEAFLAPTKGWRSGSAPASTSRCCRSTAALEPPGAFAAACERLGQPYRVLRAGERLTLP